MTVLHAALHPIAGTVEIVSSARVAGNYLVREQMLARTLPTARAFSPRYPIIII